MLITDCISPQSWVFCKKAEMEKKREEMKTARIAYDSQLQKIMTEEQYAAYSKKVQDRKAKMESKRK